LGRKDGENEENEKRKDNPRQGDLVPSKAGQEPRDRQSEWLSHDSGEIDGKEEGSRRLVSQKKCALCTTQFPSQERGNRGNE
jgi:hypothetical protein